MSFAAPLSAANHRALFWVLRLLVIAAALLAKPSGLQAQVFQLTGGSSTLLNADGGSLEIKGENYTARIDLGYLGRPSYGFFLAHPYHDALWGAGDQPIPFVFPTDIFYRSYYFLGRGLSATRKKHGTRLFVFMGATSNGFITPFLNVARIDTPATAVLYETQLSPSLRFVSRNIVSLRQTSIQAVEWTARPDLKLALSGGIGNNERYEASSFAYSHQWISLDASYALAGNSFRRVLVDTPLVAENDRENLRLELAPFQNLRIVVSRNNYVSPPIAGVIEHAAVNGFGASTSVAGQQLYGALYQSSTETGKSEALAFGTRRNLTQHLEAGVDFLRSGYSNGKPGGSMVGTVREILNSRFSVSQIITHGNGQTAVAFGGNFISNLVTASVDYQTVFLPFVQTGPSQFKQVIVLGLHFQLPHGAQWNLDTNVTPLGQVRYTTYASTYAYHAMGSSGATITGAFFHYAVKGHFVDPEGQTISGAAVRIAGELAVTDSDGNFLIRVKKAAEMPVEVALEEFTAPGSYVVVSAPSSVRAAKEDAAQDYTFVVKRIVVPAPRQDSAKRPTP